MNNTFVKEPNIKRHLKNSVTSPGQGKPGPPSGVRHGRGAPASSRTRLVAEPGRAQPENTTWSCLPPPLGESLGSGALQTGRQAKAGSWACGSPASPTGSRDVGLGTSPRWWGKGAGAGAEGGTVPTRYGWAHLHAQHHLWNQTPGEGLDSLLFRSCPGCEAQSR